MTAQTTDMRSRLSWMWVFVMLNMIYADILTFMTPGVLQQFLEGRAEQITLTPALILVFAILTEIPIAMALLSQLLPQRAARWTNVGAAVFTAVYVIGGASFTPHYIFIASLEVLACAAIVRTAWMWRESTERISVRKLAAE